MKKRKERKFVPIEAPVILGKKIDPDLMPTMCAHALKDPERLEHQVKGIMKAQGFKDVGSVLAIIESDLGH